MQKGETVTKEIEVLKTKKGKTTVIKIDGQVFQCNPDRDD